MACLTVILHFEMSDHQEIVDYLASSSDIPADLLKAIHNWLLEHGGEAATTGAMLGLWDSLDARDKDGVSRLDIDADMAKGLQRVLREINSQRRAPVGPVSIMSDDVPPANQATTSDADFSDKAARRPRTGWLFVAAMLCAILSIGSFLLGKLSGSQASDTVLLAAEGSIGKYTLPDGTHLWLNGGSTLTYSGDFNESGERRVSIDGEAYFEVTRNARRPFVVEMESMDVTVLGTSFSARSCSYADTEEVILLSGKVEVESPLLGRPITIKPDQRITLDRMSRDVLVEPADAKAYCRWIKPSATFDNEPLSDILRLISRRYGMEMTVDDSAWMDSRLSITINSSQSLDEVISIIEHLLPVEITVDGRNLAVGNASHV